MGVYSNICSNICSQMVWGECSNRPSFWDSGLIPPSARAQISEAPPAGFDPRGGGDGRWCRAGSAVVCPGKAAHVSNRPSSSVRAVSAQRTDRPDRPDRPGRRSG